MKQSLRNSIAFFGQLIPLNLLKSRKNLPVFLPFYHLVSDVNLDFINSYVVRNQIDFEKELDFLLKYFTPVTLKEIINSPANNKMHLSFDDGLQECHSIIAPILKRKGIPASFFVNPDFVDNASMFHRFKQSILESVGVLKDGRTFFINELKELDLLAQKNNVDFSEYKPYMSFDQIMSLHNDGFTIGGHSLNHPEMWTLTEDEQFQQVTDSMQWVVEHFNPEIKVFSFPFTDDGVTEAVFDRLNNSKLVDFTFGTAGLKYDINNNHFQRVPIELSQHWSINKVVHFEYLYSIMRNLFSVNHVNR